MNRYLRFAAGAGVFALVVSIASGSIAGVGFGTILVRGLVAAVVFGIGAPAILILAERLLPDLVAGSAGASSGDEHHTSGTAASGGSRGGRLNIVVEEAVGDGSSYDDEEDEQNGETDLVEEIEERSVDDEHEAMKSVIEEESGGRGESLEEESDGEEGDIPDIGSFSGSFVSSDGSEEDDYGEESGFGGEGGGSGKPSSNGNDPETIAKALRTMMSRDS